MQHAPASTRGERREANAVAQNTQQATEQMHRQSAGEITRSRADEIVHELGMRIGIDGLSLGENDDIELMVEGRFRLQLRFSEQRQAFLVAMPLGHVGLFGDDILDRLFALNMNWSRTGGGVFSVLPESDIVAFTAFVDVSHGSADRFSEELGPLVASLGRLQTFVDSLTSQQDAPAEDAVRIFL